MVVETTVARKRVVYRGKCYRLWYRLITEEESRHAIEILCKCEKEAEREKVFLDGTRQQAYEIVKLFAQELVFPVALKETLENLIL